MDWLIWINPKPNTVLRAAEIQVRIRPLIPVRQINFAFRHPKFVGVPPYWHEFPIGIDSTAPYDAYLDLRKIGDLDMDGPDFMVLGITPKNDTLRFNTREHWRYAIDRHEEFFPDSLGAGYRQRAGDSLSLNPGDNQVLVFPFSNENGIIMRGAVKDNHIVATGRMGENSFSNNHGDCIVFSFDPNHNRSEFLEPDDWCLTISPNGILQHYGPDSKNQFQLVHELRGSQFKVETDSSGWTFRLFLPWELLDLKPFRSCGFGIYAIDRDELPGIRHADIWPKRDRRTSSNPSEWGTLVFPSRISSLRIAILLVCGAFMIAFIVILRYKRTSHHVQAAVIEHPKIRKALILLEQRFSDPMFTADEVAKELNLSPGYLLSLFKEQTGKTFHDELTRLRLENAKRLLETTENKVLEVAVSSGYDNLSTFNKNFKKAYGIPPSDFRKQAK